MNPLDVRTAPMQVSFRGAQLAAENAAGVGSHALPAYTAAQVAAMARARLEGPAVKRPTLEMTTAVVITALVGLVVMGLGLMASGAFLGSRVIGLGLVVLGVVQLALIFHSRQLGARIGTSTSGGARLRDAGLCGSCAATLRPGALACEICGAPTAARDASGAILSGVPVGDARATSARAAHSHTARFDPPLATSTVEFLRPSIWIYDGLERAVPTAARLPFVTPSDPEVARRWGEARATLEQRAAGMFPRAVAFLVLAALLIVIAAMLFAYKAFGPSIVLAFAIVYLLTRAWIQLSSGRIAADRIREEFLSRSLCPCCASDLKVVGEHVSSGREATRCAACDCMWYPLHGELRYFAKRITACRWCGYGTSGLIPDERGIICCPECGKRGVGPLHVECGKCGALVPITRDESSKGWMSCVNCEARNQFLRIRTKDADTRDDGAHADPSEEDGDGARASADDANSV